ncbi:hypothetical protein [Thalassotalea sp. ND16A]|uniref:hypothetical protein n=1 Tax=Thalassotalea sp. ND16A TaxID=1535422 RepID=UPI00051A29E4|nr:hypothetical protein [Thalassotalea sp. ND16A]KGJ93506.1 hypothetical protein ND16A_1481 [Thalassotalea sp. ND16A]
MDFSKYTLNELFDVSKSIDKEKYPENFEKLQKELALRKPELDNYLLEQTESHKFTVESRIKLLSWLQIATCVGFIYMFIDFFLNDGDVIGLIVYAVIALFNGVSGYLLLKKKTFGMKLSFVNQALQLVSINTGTFVYSYTGLGDLSFGISDGFFMRFSMLSPDFRLFIGNFSNSWLLIDVVAIFFFSVLISCWEIENTKLKRL